MKKYIFAGAVVASSSCAWADSLHNNEAASSLSPHSHAPIGVMADHTHRAGEWMMSYRFMTMDMSGNLQGSGAISDNQIATTIPNRFSGQPMMPPTLRVVPQSMTMDMHMVGVMYAPSDTLTLMAMVNYIDNSMTLRTYRGGMGTDTLGFFDTGSSGLGDTKLAGLFNVYEENGHTLVGKLGVSLPTGDIDHTDEVLTPMNMRPDMRLPYAMQTGSGTYDAELGLTYSAIDKHWNWGAQVTYTARTGDNDGNYTLGNEFSATSWTAYQLSPMLSASGRIKYRHSEDIDGIDPRIMAPVQTAVPDNYGGDLWQAALGLNLVFQHGELAGHRIALEFIHTFEQHVNGVQMEAGDSWVVGYQKAF